MSPAPISAMPADGRSGAWRLADARAKARGMDPPSAEAWLVERVAWGIHSAQGLGSPRAAWVDMDDGQRADLLLRAAGAMSAFRRYAEHAPEADA